MNNTIFSREIFQGSFSHFTSNLSQEIGKYANYAITVLSQTPAHMQRSLPVAVGVIGTTNVLFFMTMQFITNQVNHQIAKRTHSSATKKVFKHIIFNGVMGGAVFGFNVLLSKTTQYALSPQVMFAISATAVALRILLNFSPKSSSKRPPPPPPPSDPSEPTLKIDEELKELKRHKEIAHNLIVKFRMRKFRKLIKKAVEDKKAAEASGKTFTLKLPKDPLNTPPLAPPLDGPPEAPPLLDGPPTAPPLDGPPGPESNVEKFLPGEPAEEPTVPKRVTSQKNPEVLKRDLGVINEYITKLENAIKGVLTRMHEVKAQVEKIGDLEVAGKKTSALIEKKKLLENKDPVSFLQLSNKKSGNILVPVYSDEAYNEITKSIDEKTLAKMIILKKSNLLALMQNKVEEDDEWNDDDVPSQTPEQKKEANEQELQEARKKLASLKEDYQGIPFTELTDLALAKGEKLKTWKDAVVQYERQLKKLEESPKTTTPQARPANTGRVDQPSISVPPALLGKHPELGGWLEAQNNDQTIGIKLSLLKKKGLENAAEILEQLSIPSEAS